MWQRTRSSWTLSIALDSGAVAGHSDRLANIEGLFLTIARDLGAFYAVAVLEHNDILIGKSLGFIAGNMPRRYVGTPWNGLPRAGAWLTWFGPPYSDRVAGAVGDRTERVGRGMSLRMGVEPADEDDVADRHPHLPEDLLVPEHPTMIRRRSFHRWSDGVDRPRRPKRIRCHPDVVTRADERLAEKHLPRRHASGELKRPSASAMRWLSKPSLRTRRS